LVFDVVSLAAAIAFAQGFPLGGPGLSAKAELKKGGCEQHEKKAAH
jgi:hypothetical protein